MVHRLQKLPPGSFSSCSVFSHPQSLTRAGQHFLGMGPEESMAIFFFSSCTFTNLCPLGRKASCDPGSCCLLIDQPLQLLESSLMLAKSPPGLGTRPSS